MTTVLKHAKYATDKALHSLEAKPPHGGHLKHTKEHLPLHRRVLPAKARRRINPFRAR